MSFKRLSISVLLLSVIFSPLSLFAQEMSSGGYAIQSDSVNFAGGKSSSASYNVEDTAGEIATGPSASASYSLKDAGYQSTTGPVTTPDTSAPSTPANVNATAVSSASIEVTWDASTDNVGVDSYRIYRDAVLVADVAIFPRDFVDTGLTPDTLYAYNVSAVDAAGNESALSVSASAQTLALPVSVTPGSSPGSSSGRTLQLTNFIIVPSDTSALVSFTTSVPVTTKIEWTASGVVRSVLSNELKTEHHLTLNSLVPATGYNVRIIVTTALGVQTTFEGIGFRTLTVVNVVSPLNVTNLSATHTENDIELAWSLPKDPSIVGVRLVRSTSFYPTSPDDGKIIFEDFNGGKALNFSDTDVVVGKTYYYAIFTKDISGNFSSGVVAHASIPLPGEPVATTTPLDNLPEAANVDPAIAALVTKDFLFIQDGDSLPVSGDTVTINGNKNLTVALKYYHLPEVLKTVAVTLVGWENGSPKSFTFLLRANRDKTRYEATIGALVVGTYGLKITVIDFKNQGLKKIAGTLVAGENLEAAAQEISGKDIMVVLGVALLILLAVFGNWLRKYFLRRRRFARAVMPVLFAVFLSGILAASVLAQTFNASFNPEINYQGRLTDTSNTPVADDSYNMRFKLYTTSTGGAPIWTETDSLSDTVTVSSGLFSLMLGSTTALSGVDFNQTLYLSVEIGGTSTVPVWDGEMSPRKVLGAVPAAFVSDTLDGLDSTQFVRSDATSTIASSSSQTLLTINQTGTGNLLDIQKSGVSQLTVGGTGIIFTNSTGTSATTTNLFATTASTTNFFGAGLSTCNSAGNALTYNGAGKFGCGSFTTAASSTLLADNNTFSGANTFSQTITGSISGNAGSATVLQNARTINGTSFNGTANITIMAASSTLLADNNTWTGGNIFGNATTTNATTTSLFTTNGTLTNLLYTTANGGAITSTGLGSFANLFASGSTTLQNFTGLNSTTTNATTTSIFSAIASSTNLFSAAARLGALTLGNIIGTTQCLHVDTNGVVSGTGVECGSGSGSVTSVSNVDGTLTISPTTGAVVASLNLGTGNVWTAASTTFVNGVTLGRSTTTNATTTNFFATTASTTNLSVANTIQGSVSGNAGTATALQNARTINGTSFDGTANITITAASSTLLGDTNTWTGDNVFGNASSTNFFATTASSTNLFSTALTTGLITSGLVNGQTISSAANFTGTLTTSGLGTFGNLLTTGSSTLQNFTALNSTSTNATTTSLFASTASSTNLFSSSGNIGLLTIGNSTSSNATSTNFFATTASSTNLFSTSLNTGLITSGNVNGQTVSSAANFTGTVTATGGLTTLSNLLLAGSTTLQNLTFVNATGSAATTTNLFATSLTAGTLKTTSTATIGGSLFISTVLNCNSSSQSLQTDGSGIVSCGTITGGGASVGGGWASLAPNIVRLSTTTDLVGVGTTSPYAKVSINSGAQATTTLALVPVSGQTANIIDIYDISSNLSSVFTSGGRLGIGSTSPSSMLTVGGEAYIDGDLTVSGASGLQNFTALNSTSTSATTTNLFATTASTTNFFGAGLSTCSSAGNALTYNGSGKFGCSTITAASTTLLVDNNAFTGANTFVGVTITRSTTTQATTTNFFSTTASSTNLFSTNGNIGLLTIGNSTSSNATSTNFFATTASSTNLFSTTLTTGLITSGLINGQTISSAANFTGSLTASGLGTFGNLLTSGSSTFQNFTFVNATGTSATTTNLFTTTASTTNFFGAGLSTCNSAGNALTYSGGKFACSSVTAASSTLLADNNTFTGANIFNNITRSTTTSATTTSLFSTTASSTNVFSTNGNIGLLTIGNSTSSNATSTNFFSTTASSTNLFSTALTTGLITSGNVNGQTISSAANFTGTLTASGLGTFGNLLSSGSSTFQNITFLNSTSTNATTTSLFTATASTTNLYVATGAGCLQVDSAGKVFSIGSACGTGSGSVTSVSDNGGGTLTISPTTGVVSASINLGNSNVWTAASTTFVNGVTLGRSTTTNATTTSLFSTTASSTNLFSTNGNIGILTIGNATSSNSFSSTASSTNLFSTNASLGQVTLANATSTTLFSTVASSTDLFSTALTTGLITSGNINGQTISSAANFTGTLTASGLGTFGNLLSSGSSTLQNFTFVNATGTSATTTNFFATTASSTNLFAAASQLGSVTINSITGSTQCLRVDSTGKISGTGSDCSTAGSSGSVNLGNQGQVPYYSANATTTLSATSTIFIATNENVGIGDTNPQNKLSVNGSVAITAGNTYKYDGINIAAGEKTLKNYFFGNAGNISALGSDNVGVGDLALFTIAGVSAGASSKNTAVGSCALCNLGSSGVSSANTALGYHAGAGVLAAGADDNTAVGNLTITDSVGSRNTALGSEALSLLYGNGGSANVKNNTAVGFQALSTGSNSIASSTALGYMAGFASTGSDDLFLGAQADALSGGLTNVTAIGAMAKAGSSNSFILGGTGSYAVNVGIGLTTPSARLTVKGTSGQTNDLVQVASSTGTALFTIDSVGNITASGLATFSDLTTTGVATLPSILFTNATGTSATTTNFFSTTASTTNFFGAGLSTCSSAGNALTYNGAGRFACGSITTAASSTLLADNNTWTGSNIWTAASSTFVNGVTLGRSTTTSATTTSLFSTTASSTNLFFTTASGGNLTSSGIGTFANLLSNGSSTLQNFTFVNATGTSATTTNIFATTASSTNLFATTENIGFSLIGRSTTTAATTTNLFSTTASSTNLFSTALTTGLITSGNVNGQTISSAANFTGTLTATGGLTTLSNLQVNGSSTLQNFTGLNSTTTNATSTSLFTTTASTTNFFGAGLSTCSSAGNALTYDGAGKFACGSITTAASSTLLVDNNAFTGLNTFTDLKLVTRSTTTAATTTNIFSTTASSTNFFSTNGNIGLLTIGNSTSSNSTSTNFFSTTASSTNLFATILNTGNITSTGLITAANLLATGSSTLQNFTGLNSTTTNATSTNLFATTASTTNFFGAGLSSCSGATNALTYNGAGRFACGSITTAASSTLLADNNAFSGNNSFANLLVNGSSTLQNFTFINATGTSATTTNLFSTTASSTNLFYTTASGGNETLSGLLTASNIRANGSTTLQNFTGVNATTSGATTTNAFATTASSTNLFSTNGNIGLLTVGNSTSSNATSTNFFSTTASSTNLFSTTLTTGLITSGLINGQTISSAANFTGSLTASGLGTFGNLLSNGSSTLQNFTFINATGTSATSTNFFATTASSTNLFATNENIGFSLIGRSTTTAATTTSLFATTASTTSFFGAGLSTCSGATNALTYDGAGKFACGSITTAASSTLLADNNTFTGANIFNNITRSTTTSATTTNLFSTTASSTNLFSTNGNIGLLTIGNSTSTNATTTNTFSTTASSTNLFSTSLNTGLITSGLINGQTISSAANFTGTLTTSGLGTFGNLLSNGSSTFQNITFVNATGTSATTTNLFATTASTTNFFGAGLSTCNSASNALIYDGAGKFGCNTISGTAASSTLLADNNTFTGANIFNNITRSTTTNATTTTIFSGTASSTNLFSTNANLGLVTIGNSTSSNATTTNLFSTTASSTNLFFTTASGGSLTSSGIGTFANLLSTGSSTLQNFTGLNSTTTNATTTTIFATTASSTNLFATNANLGLVTLGRSTTSDATTTNLFATTASTTNFFGGGLSTCTGSNVLQWSAGKFSCAASASSASSTLLVDNNAFTGANTFVGVTITRSTTTSATTTSLFSTTASSTNLFSTNGNIGLLTIGNSTSSNSTSTNLFATTASSTNLFSTALTTGLVTSGLVNGQTISSAANFTGTLTATAGLTTLSNLLVTASSTVGNGTQAGGLTINGQATTTNLLVTGSSTLQNFSFVNATGTSATTTNFFSTTASSTNLFSTSLNTGLITSGNVNGQTISSAANFTGTLTATGGLTTLSNLFLSGSTTLQNFTGINSTTTNATTTSLAIRSITGSTQCLHVDTNGLVTGTGSDCGASSASTDKFATSTTQNFTITPNSAVALVIGRNATTTRSLLEVNGTTTATNFVATSTTAFSTFAGNVGIGTTSPYRTLSVNGFINTDGTTGGYQIDGVTALQASSTNFGTFIGLGAGTSTSATGFRNTYGGYWAGQGEVNGDDNASFGYRALAIGSGSTNSAFGSFALENSSGNTNSALGYAALQANTGGISNTAVGAQALTANLNGSESVAVGYQSLALFTGTDPNTALGTWSLNKTTSGGGNTATGYTSLFNNTTGFSNTAIGQDALNAVTTGSLNTAVGRNADSKNRTGTANTTLGYNALLGVTANSHSSSTAVGYGAGSAVTTGNGNTLLGYKVGDNITTGSNNIVIGYDIDSPTASNSNTLNIGNLLFGTVLDGTGTTISSGNIGIASSTPWGRLSVEMDTIDPAFVIANQGSSTPSLYVGGVNQNGFVGFGTTTTPSLARIIIDNTIGSDAGSGIAVAGEHQIYTFNPSTTNTVQVGNRTIVQNSPVGATATNTAVGTLIRMIDNSGISNLVRGLEVVASAGNTTFGVNTGIRGSGHTFGVQGITTGLAGGTSTPAAIYGENSGTTQGDILRLYTSTMTTATSVASFYQEISTFTGTGLTMNFGKGGGTFTGKFVDFKVNDNTRFKVEYGGTTTIGQLSQTTTQAGIQIGYGGLCVDNDGACTATTTGRVTAREYITAGADLAEAYYSSESLTPGDIVFTKGKFYVGKASSSTDPVIGVVSTRPGMTLGTGEVKFSSLNEYPIGLSGRVPVRLSTENGVINVGDKIALSSIAGVGMKYDPTKPGTIIGIALEAFDGTDALSEGTVEVKTQKVSSGSTCTTTESSGDKQAWGGGDSEGTTTHTTSTGTETSCTQNEVTLIPDAGTAESSTTNAGMTVKVGSALVFLGIERPTLTASQGSMTLAQGDYSLENHSILNVKSIASANGKWSINEDGELVVESIRAKRANFSDSVEVGTKEMPTGLTLYDSATGAPYCLSMNNGAISSAPGLCKAAAPTASLTQTTIISSTTTPTSTTSSSTPIVSTTSTSTATTTSHTTSTASSTPNTTSTPTLSTTSEVGEPTGSVGSSTPATTTSTSTPSLTESTNSTASSSPLTTETSSSTPPTT
ncbi:hypothetical protein KW785_00590 [Candidatus Parcubacteria bacterium]|nr:hypothetical protein [Candidatus Parcubacteria bacterium]